MSVLLHNLSCFGNVKVFCSDIPINQAILITPFYRDLSTIEITQYLSEFIQYFSQNLIIRYFSRDNLSRHQS